jgi:putative phosphoribosyl transferase
VLFRDRRDAGRILGERLHRFAGRQGAIVLGLPRGGVEVAYEVARALDLPLDVLVVRKLGVPGHEELAFGAIAQGVLVLDELAGALTLSDETIRRIADDERRELQRRERIFREGRPAHDLRDRLVILVDDGLATGSTMRAAVRAVREHQPAGIVVAIPAAAALTCAELGREADEVICLATPEPFHAVGQWYEDFTQTSDEEVRKLLAAAFQRESRAGEG